MKKCPNKSAEVKVDLAEVLGVEKKDWNVSGLVHPFRPEMIARGNVPVGTTVEFAVKEACKSAGVSARLYKEGIAQIGTRNLEKGVTEWRNIPMHKWKKRKLATGELLRFKMLPSGGGGGEGGKNPLRSILQIVVVVVAVALTWWAGGSGGAAAAAAMGMTQTVFAGVVGLAVTTVGMMLVNAIAPVTPLGLGLGAGRGSRESESQVYGVSAGRNPINPYGTVPVPIGEGKFSPPKAASAYTQTIGEDQYLHEIFCLGIGDMDFDDIRIGDTPISGYSDVVYEIFKSGGGSSYASSLYPTGVFQDDFSVQLTQKIGWVTRRSSECQKIELDVAFQGLGYFNDEGDIEERTVAFQVQYKPYSESNWVSVGAGQETYHTPQSYTSSFRRNGKVNVGVSPNRGIQFFENADTPQGFYALKQVVLALGGVMLLDADPTPPNGRNSVEGFYVSAVATNDGKLKIDVSGGYLRGSSDSDMVYYSAAQSRPLRNTITIGPLPLNVYDVRIRRDTYDPTDDRERMDSVFTALRSVNSTSPTNTPYPVNLMALKVKATGQLSGSIDTLSIKYKTKMLDYDSGSKSWVVRHTQNPASIFRYILQDAYAMAQPQSDSLLDLRNLEDCHDYWKDKDWRFNMVFDSPMGVFDRLRSVCAAGLSSPTMLDGKWGIIIDRERRRVACALTSANSWGWSFRKSMVQLPHEIHCSFINRETWNADLRVVKTDEIPLNNILVESQSYEGVVDPSQIYHLARFHYADAKVRRREISCRCYDESIVFTRGDLVHCAVPYISSVGLQVGRVRKIVRDSYDYVTHFYTDQTQTTEGYWRRYGVRIYTDQGVDIHAEVVGEQKTQKKITLLVPQKLKINVGDKYAFGDYDEEVFEAIVVSMRFSTDWTCDVVLQDYTPQIYGELSKPIPPFRPGISDDIDGAWTIYSRPVISSWVSDEGALLKTDSGFVPRIYIAYGHPIDLDSRAEQIQVQISESTRNSWKNYPPLLDMSESNLYIAGVREDTYYDVRMRYIAPNMYGPWEVAEYIYVIGRTTPPPSVTEFTGHLDDPNGIALNWKAVDAVDFAHYRVYGAQEVKTVDTSVVMKPYGLVGDLVYYVKAVDVVNKESLEAKWVQLSVLPPLKPIAESVIDSAGLHIEWNNCKTTWGIKNYVVTDLHTNKTTELLSQKFAISPRSYGTYAIDIAVEDVFNNITRGNRFFYVVPEMEAPEVSIRLDVSDMIIEWKEVKSPFAISHYEVWTEDSQKVGDAKTTFIQFPCPPAGVHEYRVFAVDIFGNKSDSGEASFEVTPPSDPYITAELYKDMILLKYGVLSSQLPIVQWELGDLTTDETFGYTADSQFMAPPAKIGVHTFTARAIDSSGNSSDYGTVDFTVLAPGKVGVTANVIDNNILLYWTEPDKIFFSIREYIISEVEFLSDGKRVEMEVTRVSALFASSWEAEPGDYIYSITPVDIAGNIGTPSDYSVHMGQPPGFILYYDVDSLFNGDRENFVLDGRGSMIGPFPEDETWLENIIRSGGSTGATLWADLFKDSESWEGELSSTERWTDIALEKPTSWQEKIDAGHKGWLDPISGNYAKYSEIVDIGYVIPSSRIYISIDWRSTDPTAYITCKIEVSKDKTDWEVVTENGLMGSGLNFRYARYTIVLYGGYSVFTRVNFRLDVKNITAYGRTMCSADDNGPNWPSDAMDTGTWIPLYQNFIDVISLTVNVNNDLNNEFSAKTVFLDVPDPDGFRCFVVDKNGNRVTKEVQWAAFGV